MITYHRATLNDIPALISTRIDFLTGYLGEQTPEDIQRLKQELHAYFSKAIGNGSYIAYLAYNGSDIAGAGGMVIREQPGGFKNFSGIVGYVMNMYTAPVYRRKGIGRAILDRLVETGKTMGITAYELHATAEGEPLYIKAGWNLHKEPTYRKLV